MVHSEGGHFLGWFVIFNWFNPLCFENREGFKAIKGLIEADLFRVVWVELDWDKLDNDLV